MMTRKKIISYMQWLLTASVLAGAVSCKRSITDSLPADGNIAYANFVNAAEVFLYGSNDSLQFDNVVYINDSLRSNIFNSVVQDFPLEGTALSGFIRQYPRTLTGTHVVVDINSGGEVYWLPMEAEKYKLIYTSRQKTYLKTEEVSLQRQTYNFYYLVESPASDSDYAIVHVPIDRPVYKPNTVGIQIVNLSPDVGPVQTYRAGADGKEIVSALPVSLSFGAYGYAEFSTEGTGSTYNKILIRFRKAGGSSDIQTVSVPAISGAVYTVLLRGFEQETMRSVKKTNTGSVQVNVLSDLRCNTRRVFY